MFYIILIFKKILLYDYFFFGKKLLYGYFFFLRVNKLIKIVKVFCVNFVKIVLCVLKRNYEEIGN